MDFYFEMMLEFSFLALGARNDLKSMFWLVQLTFCKKFKKKMKANIAACCSIFYHTMRHEFFPSFHNSF